MKRPAAVLLLLVHLLCIAVAEDEFRDDFNSLAGWTAHPDWLGAPAGEPVAEVADGIAHLAILEPNRGMKWLAPVDEADSDLAPWCVIRYRAQNYNAATVDYVLWIRDTNSTREGLRLITGDTIKADGEWHTVAIDLEAAGATPPISQMAVQCYATETGNASLWIDYIAITDTPPTDAEGFEAEPDEGKSWSVDMADPTAWTAEPSWVGNHCQSSKVSGTQAGTAFTVPEAGYGTKWSRELETAVEGARWVSMRYRGRKLRPGMDYALYIAGKTGGSAANEEYAITRDDLISDGEWQVARFRVGVPSIKALAIQVQADDDGATMEVSDIIFHQAKPPVRLQDVFGYEPGWGEGAGGFRPVSLPAGNCDGEELARKLGHSGWIDAEKITASGIPFLVRGGEDAAIFTPVKQLGDITVPLTGSWGEVYLVLAAKFPSRDEPAFFSRPMHFVTQAERVLARIDYVDGSAEEQFPFLLSKHAHQVSRGLHVYSLALDPSKPVSRITIRDTMRRGAFGLVAMTASNEPGPASRATAPKPAIQVPADDPPAAAAVGIEQDGARILMGSREIAVTLDCADGLRVAQVENRSRPGAPLRFTPGPLFRIETGDLKLTSENFTVTGSGTRTQSGAEVFGIDLAYAQADPPLRVTVLARADAERGLLLSARCDLGGRDRMTTKLFFPELSGLQFSDAIEDTWYFMPSRGALVNNQALSKREPYSGKMPMQVIGAFGPRQGTGLYMMTRDAGASTPRYYHVQKNAGGVRLAVEYLPFDGSDTPWTAVSCNQGDWHEQFDRYKDWLQESGLGRERSAPGWFREVFNFRQQFLHFGLPTKSGMFDPETQSLNLNQVVEKDAEAFGGVDYLHLFDWGWDPVHGRCGDYAPWDYLGPPEKFKAAIEQVKDMGIPVGLYIEGYLVDPPSDLGKLHGKDWQLLDAKGEPYPYFAPSYNICSWVTDWQDYLSATYARTKQQTGAVGFYIDEYGFSQPDHQCYNEAHEHMVGASPVVGERQMTRKIRQALGDDVVIYTEESPVDATQKYQDGSFTYAISQAQDSWSPHHLNLYRFAFPGFKTIEIIVCDKPLGSNVEAVKRILFNGEAIWIEGIRDQWFEPETQEYIAKMHKVMRSNKECFAGDFPEPLVPTLREGIYANRFGERANGSGKTCWTVYNTNYRTSGGELIAVKHLPGARYVDEMTGAPIDPRIEGDAAILSIEIAPRDVAVISRTTD